MSLGNFKNIVRLASIESVDYVAQVATVKMLDRVDARRYKCPLSQPAALNGSGIFTNPVVGTTVLVGFGFNEAPFILTTIPRSAYASDLTDSENTLDFPTEDTGYPNLVSGEVAVQGPRGSKLFFDKDGNVDLQHGNSCSRYTSDDIASVKTDNFYANTEASLSVSGVIKRDLRNSIRKVEEVYDKLFDPEYDQVLSTIGRNPNVATATVTSGSGDTEILRNPALVEQKEIVYEFARTDQLGSIKQENDRLSPDSSFELVQPNKRKEVRPDALNLGPTTPNNLMETIKGTVVDRYGNILDLNRSSIDFSGIDEKGGLKRLEQEDVLLRRSIKFHAEINSRKATTGEFNFDALDSRSGTSIQNGHLHSRWYIDVDSEGLTKINIPASSDTGNIPLLTRYTNTSVSNNRDDWSFRDKNAVDVLHLGFGDLTEDGGVAIDSPGYVPQNVVASDQPGAGQQIRYRTAWHNLPTTAIDLFGDIAGGNGPSFGSQAVSSIISNSSTSPSPNAGGRSFHANLDGSLELNVGRDTVDGKSFVIDSSGGIVSRIGKDNNNNSVITQLDGHVKVQVGGDNIDADARTTNPSVKFFVDSDSGFHEIEVNQNGVFIKSSPGKNIVFESGNNLVLKAAGQALLHGEVVSIYGSANDDGSSITGERLVNRKGTSIQ